MRFRSATLADAAVLAGMNQALIRDEGHRNRMTIAQLEQRMMGFLAEGYQALIFEDGEAPIGYALYRREPEWIYLRQFYVTAKLRRDGIGRSAMNWLRNNCWSGAERVRLEVLVGNTSGIAFWRSVGFADYCLTMELEVAS